MKVLSQKILSEVKTSRGDSLEPGPELWVRVSSFWSPIGARGVTLIEIRYGLAVY